MGGEISNAVSLLAVGMITVFAVLLLVVITGNLLTRLVGWLAPIDNDPNPGISTAKVAAISAAVDTITEGKAQITRIEKG